MKIVELQNYKKILLVGYGLEGKATHEFLKKFVPGAQIGIADKKEGVNYLDKQSAYDLAIKSPGIPKNLITIPYATATNIFFANVDHLKTIGITGTKGKSTTTALVHHILQAAGMRSYLVGNIGTPMLTVLLEAGNQDNIFVVELSSYQLDDIEYSPHIAAILNLYFEHTDYHGNFENYIKAKANIVRFSEKTDYYVYNEAFKELQKLTSTTPAQAVPFISRDDLGEIRTKLQGTHNVDNICAATTIAQLFGVTLDVIKVAVTSFSPLSHRMETVGTYQDITFIDDSASTNPASTIAALNSIEPVDTLFLGGLDRGYDFADLIKKISEKKVANLVLFPNTSEHVTDEINRQNKTNAFTICETDSMDAAVQFAYKVTKKNHICLLSPAAPSYTMFSGFPERGEVFKQYVKALKKGTE